ncbi:hypothetical protein V6Z12_D06G189200 [Gossypium hirsutum]
MTHLCGGKRIPRRKHSSKHGLCPPSSSLSVGCTSSSQYHHLCRLTVILTKSTFRKKPSKFGFPVLSRASTSPFVLFQEDLVLSQQ